MSNRTHNSQILQALKAGEILTPLDSLRRFGTMRLGARIKDLRSGDYDGRKYDIATVMVSRDGKRFASYRLITPRLRMIESIPAFPIEPKPNVIVCDERMQTLF